MINLKSVVDGFRVIILGFIQNIMVAITMMAVVRPPVYEGDEDKTFHAKILYGVLIGYHLIMAVVRYVSLFVTKKLRSKMTFFMMFSVFLISFICQNWVYVADLKPMTRTQEQIHFYVWLWLEVSLFYGSIFGGALYSLMCAIGTRQVEITSPQSEKRGEQDFLDMEMLMLDMFNLIFSPTFTFSLLKGLTNSFEGGHLAYQGVVTFANFLSILQILFFMVGFFVTRASESRRSFYLHWATDVTHVSIWISLVWIPCLTLTTLVIAMWVQGHAENTLLYHALVQLGTILWFLADFRGPLRDTYEEYLRTKNAALAIR